MFAKDGQRVLLDPKTLSSSFININLNQSDSSYLRLNSEPESILVSSKSKLYSSAKEFDTMNFSHKSQSCHQYEEHDTSVFQLQHGNSTFQIDATNRYYLVNTTSSTWQENSVVTHWTFTTKPGGSYSRIRNLPDGNFTDQINLQQYSGNVLVSQSSYRLQPMIIKLGDGSNAEILGYRRLP